MASSVTINYEYATTVACFMLYCGTRFVVDSTNLLGERCGNLSRGLIMVGFDWIMIVFALMYVNETPRSTTAAVKVYERLAISALMLFVGTLLKSYVTTVKFMGWNWATGSDREVTVPGYESTTLHDYHFKPSTTRKSLSGSAFSAFAYGFLVLWTVFAMIFDFKFMSSDAGPAATPDDLVSLVPWLFVLVIVAGVIMTETYQDKDHIFYDTDFIVRDPHVKGSGISTAPLFFLLPPAFCIGLTFVIYHGLISYFGDMGAMIPAVFVMIVNTWMYVAVFKTYGAFFEGLLNSTVYFFQLQFMFAAMLLFTTVPRSFIASEYGAYRHLVPLIDFNNTDLRMIQGNDTRLMNTSDYGLSIYAISLSVGVLTTVLLSPPAVLHSASQILNAVIGHGSAVVVGDDASVDAEASVNDIVPDAKY
jgi:hypothetical protein